jgi:alpha-dioxygenase
MLYMPFMCGRRTLLLLLLSRIAGTCELLKTDTLRLGMHANWYGVPRAFGLSKADHSGLGGLVGNKTEDYGVPYALTEEFVAVYRMHPMLPDGLPMPHGDEYVPLSGLVGPSGERFLREHDSAPTDSWKSFIRYPCGNLSLFNYPRALRDVKTTDDLGRTDVPGTTVVDLAAVDLYRDRERGVKRFNNFRRALHLKPFRSYTDLTGLPETSDEVKALTEVYGKDGIEQVDLLVGNLAEKKIKGFAISETSFFIFLLMASRRLEADRFFTTDFNEKTYSRAGFAWVNSVDGIKDVLARHLPHVAQLIPDKASGFSPIDTWPKHAI